LSVTDLRAAIRNRCRHPQSYGHRAAGEVCQVLGSACRDAARKRTQWQAAHRRARTARAAWRSGSRRRLVATRCCDRHKRAATAPRLSLRTAPPRSYRVDPAKPARNCIDLQTKVLNNGS
jgi:hypothetical protein